MGLCPIDRKNRLITSSVITLRDFHCIMARLTQIHRSENIFIDQVVQKGTCGMFDWT
jgi:hypothetical protein